MKVTLTSDQEKVVVRFRAMPEEVQAKLFNTIDDLAKQLAAYIKENKLRGQVLNRRSGWLGDNVVAQDPVQSGNMISAKVTVDGNIVPYARIHEYGGVIPAHRIAPKEKLALAFSWNGQNVVFKSVNIPAITMPERSYMRSGLSDMRQQIIDRITSVVVSTINE